MLRNSWFWTSDSVTRGTLSLLVHGDEDVHVIASPEAPNRDVRMGLIILMKGR